MDQEKIGRFITECRKSKNMTQEDLALKLNVSNRSVSRWENGKTMPDYSLLNNLCLVLDIDVNELLKGERIKKEDIEETRIENLDVILKEYYKMKTQKIVFIAISGILSYLLIQVLLSLLIIYFVSLGFNDKYEITTDTSKYNEVIGENAQEKYKNKWGMEEDILPKDISNLNVLDFKMVYYNPWDANYLSYLVIDYSEEEYNKEIERLNNIGIEEYKGYYGVTGFSKYELVAMNSDSYQGFVYAITDGKSKIIYVEIIFCNYYMDIKYEEQIPIEFLPDGFDAKMDNQYMKDNI